MPLPVIADTFQAVLVWTNANAPRQATNILHFTDPSGTQTAANLYADIDASVTAAMWSYGMSASRVTSVQITPLDGVTAGSTFSPAAVAKWAGANTGHLIPQGACVVSLKSNQRGPRGRNRIFLPWVAEAVVTDGTIDNSNVTAMTTAWQTFQAAMVTAGWEMMAVSDLYQQANAVTSIVVRGAMKTQRRRSR